MEALKSSHFRPLEELPREVSITSAANHYAADLTDATESTGMMGFKTASYGENTLFKLLSAP
jgi:hypothetical protein